MAARWRIGKRGLACGGCEAVFEPEVPFHSVITDEAGELRRHDLCDACWESGEREVFCHWRTAIPKPEERARAFDLGLAAELLRRLADGDLAEDAAEEPATDPAADAGGDEEPAEEAGDADAPAPADRGALAHLLALLLVRKRLVRIEPLAGPDGPRARVEFTDGHAAVEIPAPPLGEHDVEPLRDELSRLVDLDAPAEDPDA